MRKISESVYMFEADMDLSAYSATKASEWLHEQLNPDFKHRREVHWCFEVPSQGMGDALKIAHLMGCDVKLNFDYHEDEWSLLGYYYDTDRGFKQVSMRVWSPGA